MKKVVNNIWTNGCISFIFFVSLSCHKNFDEPPQYFGPDIKSNLSIRDLRSMHFIGSFEKILDEFIIEGVVIANDKTDNFYKTLIIQDSTAGITIRLDGFGLYNIYPIGAKIFIKLKNLWLGDYAKMVQLGAGVDRSDPLFSELLAIPQPLFDRFIIQTNTQKIIEPKPVTMDQLADSLQSCLIKLSGVEFAVADTGKSYGDVFNKLSTNNIIKSCGIGNLYLRTSGFASFAATKTPRGNGSVTAVYSVFNSEKQLMIRDTSDIQMKDLRCSGSGAKVLLYEDFESIQTNKDLTIGSWKNISETGGKYFQGKIANNNKYAEIGALTANQSIIVSWLISPPINFNNSTNEKLSFQTKDGYDNGGVLQVYASTNYDGGNTPWKAKWVLLKADIAKGSLAGFRTDWLSSSSINLQSITGTVYIGFRYDGADPVNANDKRTTTFQLDEIKILGN